MRKRYLTLALLLNPILVSLVSGAEVPQSGLLGEPNSWVSPTVQQPAGFDPGGVYGDWPRGSDGLSGDWGGARSWLQSRGLRLQAEYTAIATYNVAGGLDQGFFGGAPLGITLTADLERMLGVPGAVVFADWEYFHWYNGRFSPSGLLDPTGSYVGENTNLIDPDSAVLNQLAQLFWRQNFFDGALNLQFGKMDVNAAFSAIDAAGAFQNSMAMFTSTLNPFIGTYPNETTGLQVAWQPREDLQLLVGWFDGTTAAFNPESGMAGPSTGSRGPSTFFRNEGHWFLVFETDLDWEVLPTLPGTAGVGGWLQTGTSYTAGSSVDGVEDVPGFYVQATQTLWSRDEWSASRGGGVRLFGQFGWSSPEKNPVQWSILAGLSATGVIPGRPADGLGLLGAYSRFTDDPEIFQSTTPSGLAGASGGSESAIEAFYLLQLLPWFYLQPGVEWIGTPGGGAPAPLSSAVQFYLLISLEL